jgi:hypothetical protein
MTPTSLSTTYLAVSPHCGEIVAVSLGTFAETTATVAACSHEQAAGIVSYAVPKSKAPAAAGAAAPSRHAAGLIIFG